MQNNKQLITGLLLALAVLIVSQRVISYFYPPPKPNPAATQPAAGTGSEQTGLGATSEPGSRPAELSASTSSAPGRVLEFVPGASRESITLGGKPGDALGLTLTPIGAGVEAITITQRDKDRYVYQAQPKKDEPYEVLDTAQLEHYETGPVPISFATHEILLPHENGRSWRLDDLPWAVVESTPQKAVFSTELRAPDEKQTLLKLTKTYELDPGQPLFKLTLAVENVQTQPLSVTLDQTGPTCIRRESEQYDMRKVMATRFDGPHVKVAKAAQRAELEKKAQAGEFVRLYSADQGAFAWTALANRFFGIFTRPLAIDDHTPSFVQYVDATVALPQTQEKLGDLVSHLITVPPSIPPGGTATQSFEIYVGPKDPEVLAKVNPAYDDTTKIGYSLCHQSDSRCCTFEPLPTIMTTLLHWIHAVVRNYGIAIIILVLIVRTILHPLSVYQQKQMFRMQDSMARLQPKLEALKEQYKNDKVRLNQEMMRLYADEGVNPMASVVSMLPMLIQMPILVALWTGLNTDIALRHAPFDGWWIRDLAAPDALLTFNPPLTIPILSFLPLIGSWFRDVPAFNLLPVLMGVSMWLQQKYMPKPGMQAKLDAAKKHPPRERKPGQLSPEDQLRQQQMMGYLMTFMFPIMFYYMPAGLNLYWMATNVFGIFESLVIRKHLREEKERREREGPRVPTPRKPGIVGRILKQLAAQAEEIQRKADVLSDQSRPKTRKDRDDSKDKGR